MSLSSSMRMGWLDPPYPWWHWALALGLVLVLGWLATL